MRLSDFELVTIELDGGGETLKAGQLVSGRVRAQLKESPMKVKGVRIVALGESITEFGNYLEDDDGESGRRTFMGREEYFNFDLYVFGSETSRPVNLPVGQLLSYPFSFQLPSDLPSSLEDEYGYVKYYIRAIFERPSNPDFIIQLDCNVFSNCDLNELPQARRPIKKTIDKSFCCFCICPWGKLRATISVPSSGFVPGQSIPVTVHCDNSSSVDVRKIKVSLKKEMIFHVQWPKRRSMEQDYTVAEAKCEHPFTTTSGDHVTVPLKIPSGLQPSGLEFCSTIDLKYLLIVVISFSGMHCSVKQRFNILIGTVPLRISSNANNFRNVIAPSPSARLLNATVPSAAPHSYGSLYNV